MAIIVPSKKLYYVQSPQILKNAVKGITIDLIKENAVLSRESNLTSIYAEGFTDNQSEVIEENSKLKDFSVTVLDGVERKFHIINGYKYEGIQNTGSIEIQRKVENGYIKTIEPSLSFQIEAFYGKGKATVIESYSSGTITFDLATIQLNDDYKTINNFNYSLITEKTGELDALDNFKKQSTISFNQLNQSISLNIDYMFDLIVKDFSSTSNGMQTFTGKAFDNFYISLAAPISYDETSDYFKIYFAYFSELTFAYLASVFPHRRHVETQENVEFDSVYFNVRSAKLTLNETVRKIETTDITETITSAVDTNGVQLSVGQNQFIKSGTTYDGSDATVQLWATVVSNYKGGKSYVRFVSSLGDFYDENGEKVISANSSDKMMLDIYDEIVVMKQSKHKIDESIMFDNNGNAKIYSVVSVKPYFDGALWQEVVAIDTGKTVDLRKTTYTTIGNKAGGLTYKIISNQIRTEENSAGGITYIIGA